MRRFLPFILFLVLLAALFRVDFFFTIVYLFVGASLLGQWWSRRNRRQITVHRDFVRRAFCDDEVAVRVSLQNHSRLPVPWLEIHESLPVELISPPFHTEVFSLGQHGRRDFIYRLQCRKRGVYPLGPLVARTGDLLGLDDPEVQETAAEAIVVYPRVRPLAQLGLPTRSPLVALPARSPLFEDPSRLMGVRDYVRGDSPRRIHWTATASAGRLLVKQYAPAIARETLLILDLHRDSYDHRVRYDATELAITVAASLANHIIVHNRLPAGLAMEAVDGLSHESTRIFLPPRSERTHLTQILELLARAQLSGGPSFLEVVRRERPRLAWGTTVTLITGQVTEDLLDELASLRHGSFAVSLILVQAARPRAELQARASLLHIPMYPLWTERDLERGL